MTYPIYFSIRQILMGLLILLGGHLTFETLPIYLRGSAYQRSSRMMGVAFLFVPLSCFIYTKNNPLDLVPYISTAISLTAYFPTFVLMSLAFLILLGKIYGKVVAYATLVAIVLYPIPLWISIMYGSEELISVVTTATYSYFVILIILLVTVILWNYKQISSKVDNFYSDDMTVYVKWVSKSIKLLIGLTLTCVTAPIFFTYPLCLRFFFMVYGVACYVYIFYSYRQMLNSINEQYVLQSQSILNYTQIKLDDKQDETLSAEVMYNIQNHLKKWVSQKGYIQKNITINDLAKEIKTNRTYLSKYINTTYNCTFRSWVTQLRIEEAKEMLSDGSSTPLRIISDKLGFASVESFTHIFTRTEGQSPSRWREENKQRFNNTKL